MLPVIFGENLFDDLFDDAFSMRPLYDVNNALYGKHAKAVMKTDVRELDDGYEVAVDLPGFKKDEVKIDLKDGYLTITASANTSNDQKDSNGKYIRRERYSGTCSRRFYVGEEIEQSDIKAKFENGILKISVPKKEAKPAVEENKYITIEG